MNSQSKVPLVIVNGAAGAGKSTLAAIVAARLRLPLLDKDTIKEAMADVLGADDRAASYQLGLATFAIMQALAQKYLSLGVGAVLEAPFYGQAAEELKPLAAAARTVILQCVADRKTLYCRVRNRAVERHWVHFDNPHRAEEETFETWSSPDLAAADPPAIDAPVLTINTVGGYRPSIEEALTYIHQHAFTLSATDE
jgi:predicted kinase